MRAVPLALTRALALCWLLSLAGCSVGPAVTEPVGPAGLAEIVDGLAAAHPSVDACRGTGDGEISVTGRTLKVSFAVVYDRPGWLRADLRPQLGTMGANLTALGTMEGDCARMFFPARLLVITGCVSDVAGEIEWLDPAALVLGVPDPSFIADLTDVTSTRSGGRLRLDGRAGGARVRVEIDEELMVVTALELGRADSDDSVRVTYSGHGWKPSMPVPREVELTALEGTSSELGVTIRYDTLKGDEPVDRKKYELVIPPGVPEMDWRDLSIWR